METKKLIILIVVALCILSIPMVYQTVTGGTNPAVGTWAYTVESPAGSLKQTLILNADMSGTVSVPAPENASYPISNAMVDGQSLSFVVESGLAGQEVKFSFHGTVNGDEIQGEYVSVFGNSKVTGKRDK